MLHRINYLGWLGYMLLLIAIYWLLFVFNAVAMKGIGMVFAYVALSVVALFVFLYMVCLKIRLYDDKLELYSMFGKRDLLYSQVENLEFETEVNRSGTGITVYLTSVILTLKGGVVSKIRASYYTRSDDLIHDLSAKLLDVNGKMRIL